MTLDTWMRETLAEVVRAVVREELSAAKVEVEPVKESPHQAGLLTVREVAGWCRVSLGTVRNWIGSGDLTAARTGRHYLVRPVDLERFLAGQRRREPATVDSEMARILSTAR